MFLNYISKQKKTKTKPKKLLKISLFYVKKSCQCSFVAKTCNVSMVITSITSFANVVVVLVVVETNDGLAKKDGEREGE